MQKRIQIPRNGIELVGVLFTPEHFDETKQYPAIVVVHPCGGVKEQTAGLYAGKLAEAGFVAVAYDACHQGESGGEPRFLESPSARVADISYVIDYLNNLPYLDNNRIGALGICAGGGYADNAAQIDKRIKAVATCRVSTLAGCSAMPSAKTRSRSFLPLSSKWRKAEPPKPKVWN